MKIALGQINPTVGDIDGNVAKIIDFAHSARQLGAKLVIFPELAICGYPPMDLLLKESFIQANLKGLERICKEVVGIAALVGFVDVNKAPGRPLFNALACVQAGQVRAKQYKTLLPTYDVFDEDRYFEPASTSCLCVVDGLSLGLSICEDVWHYAPGEIKSRYRVDPIARLMGHAADAIVNVAASPFSVGKTGVREELLRQHATRHCVPIIFVNQVGGNDQLVFDGGSMVLDRKGQVIARAASFEEDLLIVEVSNSGKKVTGRVKNIEASLIGQIYDALVLGTRDYMRKCGFDKAIVGLSGGIDSAVTAAIACQALGKENLIGVAMPSPYSSEASLTDASRLAKNLGIELKVIPINAAMNVFEQMLYKEFVGRATNTTEENIQARLRGMILMALSNKLNCLVLTTGNKSELAVGYCTLYGDMAGGLAVISDVPKMMVYELAGYINAKTAAPIIPKSTIKRAPSAELRTNQTDQDSLPPYPVLDAIINAYVEQRLKPDEIVNLGFGAEVVSDVIKRIDSNEYKRKQAAPGLKVTARAFGLGWRMPIAQRFREQTESQKSHIFKMLC